MGITVTTTIPDKLFKEQVKQLRFRLQNHLRNNGRVMVKDSYQKEKSVTHDDAFRIVIFYRAFYVGRKSVKKWPKFYDTDDDRMSITKE